MGVIAVDCGGTNCTVAYAGHAAAPDDAVTVPTPASVAEIVGLIGDTIEGLPAADGVGVAIAGLVDHDTGTLEWMPHRPGSAPIASAIGARTGLPVFVDNDANAAALAEATGGAGAGHRMVLMLTVGTGIGAGLVIDGKVERGRGFLGEVGHMTVDPRGLKCSCGRTGCWETVASGTALDRAAREVGLADGKALVAAATSGNDIALEHLDAVAAAFGRGMASLVQIFDPDVIVVGGGVGDVGEVFLAPARLILEQAIGPGEPRRPTPVVAAGFGHRAGIVGAALMAGAPL